MKNKTLNLRLDVRWLLIGLVLVIALMLALWRPWVAADNPDETITVKGETTLKAEPDEYVFSPRYSTTNRDKQAALQAMSEKSTEVTAALKDLGVRDEAIKTNIDGYENKPFPERAGTDEFVYNLTVTITVNNKDDAQKIQDYLGGTDVEGSVTPFANFSEAKRKELENQARDEATKDARRKAEQSADNLGFRLSRVKSVEDGSGFGGIEPMPMMSETRIMDMSARPAIQVMPGQNELRYSVTVTYYVR